MKLASLIFFSLMTAISVNALEMGPVSIAGTGCFGATVITPVHGDQDNFTAPLRVRLNKNSNASFERKSCQIRIPVRLKQNEKLQISDISQSVRFIMYAGIDLKSNLEVSVVGQRTEALKLDASAGDENRSVTDVLRKKGLVVESACGKDTIITGNLNILATGTAKAFASTGALNLKLKVVSCE